MRRERRSPHIALATSSAAARSTSAAPPIAIAVSPDGTQALVVTAFYDRPGLAVVDLRLGQVERLDVGAEPHSVVFGRSGRSAYVAGGGRDGTLTRVDPEHGRVHPPLAIGAHPRGLALMPDGKHALVALNGEAAVAVVALRKLRVTRRIKTRAFPAQVAIAPDGKRALVTHNGFGDRALSRLDLVKWRARAVLVTGLDPAAVAFDRSGKLAVVASAGANTVTVLDARTGRRRRRVHGGGAPRCVAIAGRRAFVADGRSGQLKAIRLGAGS